ncbi:MAG TPA: VOC family protein [Steroidobacteraceae bacterium]|nr:VOC family protein [Steroidobacteraceae bacterium]
MGLIDLHHVAIRTDDVAATNRFYIDVLGMREVERPPMNFPGSWLAIGQTMIHVMGGARGRVADPQGGAVDHIALRAHGIEAFKRRFDSHGVAYRESSIAGAGLRQLFLRDPNGVLVELNFSVSDD